MHVRASPGAFIEKARPALLRNLAAKVLVPFALYEL